jgi:phage shock protein A
MGIMTRFVRLCKADIHGVMDQMEDKGLLLRQNLRDMQEELDKKESRLAGLLSVREETERERQRCSREGEALEKDLSLAIAREKDEIARTLIRKNKALAHHAHELNGLLQSMDSDISRISAALEEQRLIYDQLRLKASGHLRRTEREKWGEASAGAVPRSPGSEPSEAEVELELLRRKESMKGGTKP